MKQYKCIFLFVVLMSMINNNMCAYNIAVKNLDGKTIYYDFVTYNNQTALSVTKYSNPSYSGIVNIPESVENDGKTYPVVAIGRGAFFECKDVTCVTIPNSVISIGMEAFQRCTGLTDIIIPNSVIEIGNWAFSGCRGFTSITIPNSVTKFGFGVFSDCKNLSSIIISDLSYWLNLQFEDASCNPLYYAHHLYIDKREVIDLVIPNNCISIANYAFAGCSLKAVTIPNSVTTIGEGAFIECSDLASVVIGSGITSIGTDAFKNTNLKKTIWLTNTPPLGFNYASGTINYVSNDRFSLSNQVKYQFLSSFFDVDGIRYVPVSPSERTCDAIDCLYNESAENVNIGQTITNKGITLIVQKVNPYTCYGNNYIKEVNLSLGGDIGNYAFYGCTGLNAVTVSNKGSIGNSAFSSCSSLTTATISNKGDIGANAFSSCSALTTATISNQGDIGTNAFQSCSALTTATISNQGGIGYGAFTGCSLLETAELGQNVTSIGRYAFGGCSKLKSIVIPDAVTSLGSYAFNNCAAMTSAKTGNGIETIDEYTFSGCSSLTEMIIGSNVETIALYAFSNCSALTSIIIPQAVTNINNYAFSGCNSLKEFKIADSDTELTIGSNGNNPIFSSCPLETVYIGRNINYKTSSDYGYSPFYRNTSLKTVKITDKETEISENEFYGCTNLQSVTIGDGVITIGNWAFSGCQSLKYFAFGSQVQSIGQEAFSDCSAVVEISSKATTPPTCGSQALDDINKWECRLFVPEGCMATYQDADQWKDFFFTDEGEGTSGQNPDDPSIDNPDGKKCEAPTISVVGGKIKFDCNTNGVLYHYNITCLDVKDGVINTSEVEIHKTYRISVYASKDGYDDSATTTKDIKMTSDGDLNDDGKINVADVVELTNIIMNQEP